MKLDEILEAVDCGKTVCWKQPNYVVKKTTSETLDPISLQYIPDEEYNIVCTSNQHTIGLTWTDGVTMNGKEEDFYILEECEDAV